MALSTSGPISLSQIQTEFGGVNPISMSEYYRDGLYTTPNNSGIPTLGQLTMGNFLNTSYLPVSFTNTDNRSSATNASTYTFTSVAFGTTDVTREIFIIVNNGNNANAGISSVTIGGITATIHGSTRYGLVSAVVPAGTTGTVVVNLTATTDQITISVFRVVDRRILGGAVLSSTIIGSGYVSSVTLNKPYPIRAFGLVAAFTLSQGGSTPTATLGSDYVKLSRYATLSFELYNAYLSAGSLGDAPYVTQTAVESYDYFASFNIVSALGGVLFIID